VPGNPDTLMWRGQPVAPHQREPGAGGYRLHGFGDAAAGCGGGDLRCAPDGSKIKVEALSDDDRRTLVRWIDLGCPIDFDYDAEHPEVRGYGWMGDDNRPTLAVTYPRAGMNRFVNRILVGML